MGALLKRVEESIITQEGMDEPFVEMEKRMNYCF